MATLSNAQVSKVRSEINARIKAANADFRAANPEYADIALNMDDVKIIAALASNSDGSLQRDGDIARNRDIAKLRADYVAKGRDTTTLNVLTIKTEKDISEDGKFTMQPYLGAKRYRVDGQIWKSGYQVADDVEPKNRFVSADGSTFQVLRANGLFQLMSDAEIDDYTDNMPVDFETYFQLFL